MAKTLTATDRKALIRLASTMAVGSPERRAILAGLKKVKAASKSWSNSDYDSGHSLGGEITVSWTPGSRDLWIKGRRWVREMSGQYASDNVVYDGRVGTLDDPNLKYIQRVAGDAGFSPAYALKKWSDPKGANIPNLDVFLRRLARSIP